MFGEEESEGGQWKSGDERRRVIANILMPVRIQLGTLACPSSLALERRPYSASVNFGCTESVPATVIKDISVHNDVF